jgi:predicted transcriptional regulator
MDIARAFDVLRSEQRGKILLALEESTEPMKTQEIADETGMKPVTRHDTNTE